MCLPKVPFLRVRLVSYTEHSICGLGGCFEVGALLLLCTNHIHTIYHV